MLRALRFYWLFALESQAALGRGIDDDMVAIRKRALKQETGERIFDLALHGALERARSKHGVVALAGHEVFRCLAQFQTDLALAQPLLQAAHLNVYDLFDLF